MNKPTLTEESIVIGCNYHTKWQSHKAMRFILKEVKGDKAILTTRTTKKTFLTNTSDLIFIMSEHNIQKAITIIQSIPKNNTITPTTKTPENK